MNVPTRNDSTVIEKPSCDAGVPSRPTMRPPPPARPPQFTATRSGPWLDATRTASSTSSSFSTSQRTNSVLRPSSATIRRPPSSLTSAMTTLAPAACRRRAAASPSPEAPPVTIAPTPLSSMPCAYRTAAAEAKFGPVQFAESVATRNAGRSQPHSTHCSRRLTPGGSDDRDGRPALHRLGRAHPRAPDRDARLRTRRVARPGVAHRDPRRRRRVPPLQRLRHAVERPLARRDRGLPRRGGRPRPQRQHALHRGAAGGVQRQGAAAGHGHRRHRPRGAVPHVDARTAVDPRRGVRGRPGARVQRLGVGPHPGG